MHIVRHPDEPTLPPRSAVVTLGNFDGIHRGHQALIGSAVADARSLGLSSVVLTFEPHPLKVLSPDRAPQMILAHKDKLELLRSLGVDVVVVQTFDRAFAKLDAEEFVRGILVGRLKAMKVWVGQGFRFGQGRKGTVEDLVRWGGVLDFQVGTVEPILVDGAAVSSSRIRQLVTDGRVEDVQTLLGRYHFISGRVVNGHRRGREIGFPTANISTRTEVLPADGIYATLFSLGERRLLSVSSIGLNPTFGAGPRTVESYIMNFDEDIYGASVKLAFVKRLREERKFDSAEALTAQIRRDVADAEAMFGALKIASA